MASEKAALSLVMHWKSADNILDSDKSIKNGLHSPSQVTEGMAKVWGLRLCGYYSLVITSLPGY